HLPHRVGVGHVLLEREAHGRTHPLDVGARAEARAVAGEDDRVHASDVDECLRQLADQLSVERVAPVRSRERDAQDRVVALDAQRAHGLSLRNEHGSVSLPDRGTPAGFVLVNVHAMRENSRRPATQTTGLERRTVSGYAWKCPAAQYGLQSFW